MTASDARIPDWFASARHATRRTFGSLDTRNYRLYFAGDLVSHVGGWMQTMAEAWLVLELTGNGAAVGATFAFRFLPVAVFGLFGGAIADRFDRRRTLMVTQACSSLLAVMLWWIVWQDAVEVWMVYALAVALGFVTVVDEPARHAFVEEMVGRDRVSNAVALSSAMSNSARITGPALAGIVIGHAGVAWVFLANAISFSALWLSMFWMDRAALRRPEATDQLPSVRAGLRYAWNIRAIRPTIALTAVIGTLVYNFPTTLSLMAHDTFDSGADLAGFFMAVLGVGTVIGGLIAASRKSPTTRTVIMAAGILGATMLIAVAMPTRNTFVIALVPVGIFAVFYGTSANAHLQVNSSPEFRGRVMSIYVSLTLGTTIVGGPFVGWICQHWTPHTGIATAGAAALGAAIVAALRFGSASSSTDRVH